MSGAMFISDDLVFSFEVSPYMCVPVEILVCGNSLWKGSEWYVCASTTWWFLASCCSSGSSEGPTLLMRRSTVWQHLVVISATQLRFTPPNGSPRQPIWIWANHTTLKHTPAGQREKISMVNGRQTQWGKSWQHHWTMAILIRGNTSRISSTYVIGPDERETPCCRNKKNILLQAQKH